VRGKQEGKRYISIHYLYKIKSGNVSITARLQPSDRYEATSYNYNFRRKKKLLQTSFSSLLFSNYFYINQAQETNKLPKKDSRYKQTGKGVVTVHT
jgi:tRNA(His) 5'-end guanylyltransferase